MNKEDLFTVKIIVAPNSFKGSLTSRQAVAAITQGLQQSGLICDIVGFPVVDGGSDTMEVLTELSGGKFMKTKVQNALGEPIVCLYGWLLEKKFAVIGISEASGIHLIPRKDAMRANTFGTGQQLLEAIRQGAETIVLGLGGSATTDGGTGILRALGLKFFDNEGDEITDLPAGLQRLHSVSNKELRRSLHSCKIILLCDVENPLLGNNGSAAVYAPQKGADAKTVEKLECCLEIWARITKEETGTDISDMKYGGAAGGVAAGLHAWLGAELKSGIDYLVKAFDFERLVSGADYVITGEGQLDTQTIKGKGPFGIATYSKKAGAKIIAFAGSVENKSALLCFDEIVEINRSKNISVEMKRSYQNLTEAAREWATGLISR